VLLAALNERIGLSLVDSTLAWAENLGRGVRIRALMLP
jgi:hypothetical protein